ncbi:thioredoxin-like protein 4B isoform X1 [Canis lupus baileyi]|uniref:Thioredoxin like 4B n=2 Tax=Canis lupus familiaris TaxID=9615 RepID=A0A8P0SP46_CANLF|nr:thioredoxin-like protein 4B isoform X1 [Canis lupus familiaris]XP_025282494.1 thioredoxin-like protein 4B isoform X1 [Canis lupus dingo]XP_035572110.1 thioredoxin-like protein 4B isoform X1 [Canis lupus dingo]XP_038384955.1 thioredoxin-like protein 4B isoform X1 [Canis lupus familiaris]XP_038394386.1 thioredoxin-like protein 4B isoform X1 [Canis lupus familiaris]XP_038394387.1 thioredoxin-like protein 4B isoform X1 [Canis lupus familiaris]XP_038523110.1 thioredoxin-like protein 4B isoform |eukprot:XP_005620810.1 thioredoxin-like protein 4B isoform X1 [Canis lupus familiaris]
MSFLLPKLNSKKEVDQAIKSTAEKVLVLRFGRDEDPVCLQLDDILSKTSPDLSKMAAIYLVDVDQTPVYTHYFDISYIPSTVFFFNGQHMKVDYGNSQRGLSQQTPLMETTDQNWGKDYTSKPQETGLWARTGDRISTWNCKQELEARAKD